MIRQFLKKTHSNINFCFHDGVITRKKYINRIRSAFYTLLLTLFVILNFNGISKAEPNYVLSSGTPSSNYYSVGIALSTLLKLKHSPQNNILLTVKQTKGARDNLISLLEGKSDIAFVDANTLYSAIMNRPPFHKYKSSIPRLKTIAALWPDIAHFILHERQVKTHNINDFRNLVGESVSFDEKTTASAYASRSLFRHSGIYFEQLFKILNFDTHKSARAFMDERIAGLSLVTHERNRIIEKVFNNREVQATFVGVNDVQIKQITKTSSPVWEPYYINPNTYPNQETGINTVAQKNFLIVRDDFSEKAAYHISRTFFENLTFIQALHKAAHKIDRNSSTTENIIPLHQGTALYLEESTPCSGLFCLFN